MIHNSYFIITFGCAMNFSDSERISAILENQGYAKAPTKYEADLVVIVACAVRQHAVDRIFGNIKELKVKSQKPKVKIIITGCLIDEDRKKISRIAIQKRKNSKEFVQKEDKLEIENWKLTNFISKNADCLIGDFFKIAPKYQFKDAANVPIMTGCDNFCSYCAVPHTRGREYSRPAEEILCEIFNLVKNGCNKITLLGQNVDSYNGNFKFQILNFKKISNIQYPISLQSTKLPVPKSNTSFSKLLKLINDIPGNFKIKFLTSHPKDMSDELIETIASCEKIDKEKLHLPVQSGDNIILEKMNRKYTAEHYKNLIKKIRAKLPDIKISTDIIVGFPGETDKQFNNTVDLLKEIGFSAAYISCYSPRSGTAASKMKDDILIEEKKRRKLVLEQMIIN